MRKVRRGSSRPDSGGEQGFWPSYTDMMSAVALILFFLMLLAYIQNIITNNDLLNKEEELKDTLEQLSLAAAQVEDKEKELQAVSDTLEIARQDLDEQQIKLDDQQAQLRQQEEDIAQQAAYILQQQDDIAAQQDTIAQQQAQMERQQIYLNNTQAELSQVRAQMQAAAFLRVDIVEKIRKNVEEVMGNSNTISISDTGSLILSESVLFDRGSSALKANSKQLLDQLAVGFAGFLASSDSLQYVDTIVIGGHADSTGSDELNRKLSADRANSVLGYLMSTQGGVLEPYAQYFCAAGYSSTRPVASNDTPEGQAQNRRIEISIILKDESVLEALNQYLAIQVPDTTD